MFARERNPNHPARRRTIVAFGTSLMLAATSLGFGLSSASADGSRLPPSADAQVRSISETVFDWGDISDHSYRGFDVGPCGGEAPLACVSRSGVLLGTVEHWSAPTSDFDFLDGVEDPMQAIRLVADDFLRSTAESRPDECPGFGFIETRPRRTVVAGDPGFRWGFALTKDGKVVERTVTYAVVQDDVIHLLTANAAEADSCFVVEGGFTVKDLGRFRRAFRSLAQNSLFPDPLPE